MLSLLSRKFSVPLVKSVANGAFLSKAIDVLNVRSFSHGTGVGKVEISEMSDEGCSGPICLTESAAERVRTLLEGNSDAIGIRLGLDIAGCSGNTYSMNYAFNSEDLLDECERVQSQGVDVYIDNKALMTIFGTVMDWQENVLSAEFVFSNPNAASTCGCGSSFQVE
eukprot:TRINITY_DN843_c0_g1_i1.p1 TRINITY_DN843_c0_g1~~TRINITY_DN843_c0_g1_i1.p1  ORF type:complete len:188 (+),score=48.60 TRINITY_DN843_c0_g1_i1:66-566(+)